MRTNLSFAGIWMELENIILSEVTQTQKDMHGMYSLISGYEQQQQKYRIQFTGLKKVNKLKGPSEDASVPLRREKKAITRGEGGRDLGGKWDGEGRGEHDQVSVGGSRTEALEGQQKEWKQATLGGRRLGKPSRMHQRPES